MSAEHLERVWVWRQEDGFWRWSWARVDPETGEDSTRLMSHRAFDSVSQTRESAQSAFPRLVVGGPTHDPEPPARERGGPTAGAPGGAGDRGAAPSPPTEHGPEPVMGQRRPRGVVAGAAVHPAARVR